jgi:glycosyltransferase involved in cell wall biosynthesis
LVASRRSEFRLARHSFSRWQYSQVDGFLAISRAVRDRLVADGIPARKIEVVHEGVDVERGAAAPSGNVHAALFLPTHAPVVGTVGALVAQKNHHTLIDAAALVVRAVPDARFVILGDGELRPALEEQIRHKHLERHVFLAGFRADVPELMKDFDVFALSSIQEGLCTSLVDAMAAAKPAVATAVGGVPEVVADGETGFLVPPRDHPALAEKIVRLLTDEPLRRRMGEAGLARARRLFTVERMVEQTAAVYERLGGRSLAAGTASHAARG